MTDRELIDEDPDADEALEQAYEALMDAIDAAWPDRASPLPETQASMLFLGVPYVRTRH